MKVAGPPGGGGDLEIRPREPGRGLAVLLAVALPLLLAGVAAGGVRGSAVDQVATLRVLGGTIALVLTQRAVAAVRRRRAGRDRAFLTPAVLLARGVVPAWAARGVALRVERLDLPPPAR